MVSVVFFVLIEIAKQALKIRNQFLIVQGHKP
jgi:hypothetical protein